MYLDILKSDLLSKNQIPIDPNVTYTVIEGPNGSGKTSIGRSASDLSVYNIGKVTELSQSSINGSSSPSLYRVQEPPDITLECLPAGVTARRFLKSGMAGFDPREQLAIFMMSRRRLQEKIMIGNHNNDQNLINRVADYFNTVDPEVSPLKLYPNDTTKRVYVSDRGLPSSYVFQVRGYAGIAPHKSSECQGIIWTSYDKKYLNPYDLTIFVQPDSRNTKPPDPDDFFEGKIDEVGEYANEIVGYPYKRFYSNNTVWVDNDPTGKLNTISIPTICSSAAITAVFIEKQLEQGKRYTLPFYVAPNTLERSPSPLTRELFENIYKVTGLKSGNILLYRKRRFEVDIEITEDLPAMG